MNIIFAGTPLFAERHLAALIESGHEIVAVYTQPDRPAGRGKKLQASPVKQLALTHGLRVEQPVSLKDPDAQATLRSLNPDLMVVVAYGLLLPQAVLDIPALACLNVHGSLLPRWRGAAPIQRAVEAGDTESGVTIMKMEAGLDTGPMLLKRHCPISQNETSASLHDKLAELGPQALLESVDQIHTLLENAEVQDDSQANYAHKISKDEALIDWTQPATLLDRQIRAFNPFPISYSFLNDDRVKIHQVSIESVSGTNTEPGRIQLENDSLLVQCGEGRLRIETLQLPGKKAIACRDFLNSITDRSSLERFQSA